MSRSSSILVTGGAGYIGSVTVDYLRRAGRTVVVIDDLKRGHRESLPSDVPLYVSGVGDETLVSRVLRDHDVDCCVHFANLAYVAESVREPSRYYENNVVQGIKLINTLLEGNVRSIVFSSSCSTYGEAETPLLAEDHPQRPLSPYGWSKLILEQALDSYRAAYGLKFAALRYFNAGGATENLGEDHEPEPHLIPSVLAAAADPNKEVLICGADFPTRDGSAVRDFIHVTDLAHAHILALEYLQRGGGSTFLNLGTGHGHSVFEVVETAERITGRQIRSRIVSRRDGDAACLVANAERAKTILGWVPTNSSMDQIIRSAWLWKLKHTEINQTQPSLALR